MPSRSSDALDAGFARQANLDLLRFLRSREELRRRWRRLADRRFDRDRLEAEEDEEEESARDLKPMGRGLGHICLN